MALPQAGQGNNGAIHLSIQRGKGLAGDKKGKLELLMQLRIWSKQPGKWYLVGIRIAVPDASRGKVLGRKVLSNAEKKAIREGETVNQHQPRTAVV